MAVAESPYVGRRVVRSKIAHQPLLSKRVCSHTYNLVNRQTHKEVLSLELTVTSLERGPQARVV
jgi:hypothetical protein